ncbi:MAG: hypothetical protein GY711_11415 [bacterium]|nr:hypothetical protein [bacterium]
MTVAVERELLTMRQYAERRGVSPSSVSRAVRQGRLSLAVVGTGRGRRIDPELADREWQENTNHAKRPPGSGGGENVQAIDGVPAGVKYADARAAKEYLAARRLALEVAELEGRLVDSDAQVRAGFEEGRRIQKAIQAAIDRLTPQLSPELEENEVKAHLVREIMGCLQGLAGADG